MRLLAVFGRCERLGLALTTLALSACGQKSWTSRPATIPVRALFVDERQLLAPAGPGQCAEILRVHVRPSCSDRCGPIQILRDGAPMAALLAPKAAEVAPVPTATRTSNAKPPADESRRSVEIALPGEAHRFQVAGACAYSVTTQSSRVEADGAAFTVDAREACDPIQMEIDCK